MTRWFRPAAASLVRVALCLSAVAGAGVLDATIVPRMSLEAIVSESSSIVHGRVTRAWSAWDPERTAIWTHYEIEVEDALKGGGTKVVVSEPGGEIDGMHMQVIGAPVYEVGEEAVIFLTPTPLGYLRTCGWGQGRFEVERTARGKAVRSRVEGVELADLKDPAARRQAATALESLDGLPLDDFKARVRAVLGQLPPR